MGFPVLLCILLCSRHPQGLSDSRTMPRLGIRGAARMRVRGGEASCALHHLVCPGEAAPVCKVKMPCHLPWHQVCCPHNGAEPAAACRLLRLHCILQTSLAEGLTSSGVAVARARVRCCKCSVHRFGARFSGDFDPGDMFRSAQGPVC